MGRRSPVLAGLACLVAIAASGEPATFLDSHDLDADSLGQWRLPERLQEISGLAMDARGRLFAIEDERAIVYELNYESGRLVKAFALGNPVLRGDFEGMAIVADRFFLVTSDGDILETVEGGDGEQVDYERYVTDLGLRCEVEGLAATLTGDRLLVACKEPRGDAGALEIHGWSLREKRLEPGDALTLPLAEILPAIGATRLNPSGIAVVPQSGNLLLVAARQRALVEVTANGRLLAALRLPMAQRHLQPEGIELAADGKLLIADEGGGHKARLAVYHPRAHGNEPAE